MLRFVGVRYESKRSRSRSRSISRSPRVRGRRYSRSPKRSPSPVDRRPVLSSRLKSRLGPPKSDNSRRGRSRSRSSSRSRSADVASRKRPLKGSPPSSPSSPSGEQRGLVSYEDLSPENGAN